MPFFLLIRRHLFIIIIYYPLTKVLTASLYCNRNRGRERL